MSETRATPERMAEVEATLKMQRPFGPIEGEVGFIPRAWLFCHFDSRGGSTLVVGAQNTREAIAAYEADGFEGMSEWDVGMDDLENGGRFGVVVVGSPLPYEDGTELHADYRESANGWLVGRVQIRTEVPPHDVERWSAHTTLSVENEVSFTPWQDLPYIVLWWAGDRDEDGGEDQGIPAAPASRHRVFTRDHYRIVPMLVAEDAFGLTLKLV